MRCLADRQTQLAIGALQEPQSPWQGRPENCVDSDFCYGSESYFACCSVLILTVCVPVVARPTPTSLYRTVERSTTLSVAGKGKTEVFRLCGDRTPFVHAEFVQHVLDAIRGDTELENVCAVNAEVQMPLFFDFQFKLVVNEGPDPGGVDVFGIFNSHARYKNTCTRISSLEGGNRVPYRT